MSECERHAAGLSEYLDGELDGPAAVDLERHLGDCAACRERLEQLRGVVASAGELPTRDEPPAEAWSAVAARLSSRPGRAPWRAGGLVAAGALLALVISAVFRGEPEVRRVEPEAPAERGAVYLLLLHEDTLPELSPERERQAIREYRAWAVDLAKLGSLEGGEKLANEAAELRGGGAAVTVARPDGRPGLGGYFLIRAESLDAAIAVAKTCPHLEYGGWIEVRPIDRG